MTTIKTLVLAFTLSITPCAIHATSRAEAAEAAPVKPDLKKLKNHLETHQTYPATRAEMVETCSKCPEFNDGEKAWFAAHLPEGKYKSAAEAFKALTAKK
jgi:hypothetical protein